MKPTKKAESLAIPMLVACGMALVAVWSDLLGYSSILLPAALAGNTAATSAAFTFGRLCIALLFCMLARPLERWSGHAGLACGVAMAPLALLMVLAAHQNALDARAIMAGCAFLGSACSLLVSTALVIIMSQTCSLRACAVTIIVAILGECAFATPMDACAPMHAQLAVCTIAPLAAGICVVAAHTLAQRQGGTDGANNANAQAPINGVSDVLSVSPVGTRGLDGLSVGLLMLQLVLAMVVSSSLRALSPMEAWGLARSNFLAMSILDLGSLIAVCAIVLAASLVAFVIPRRASAQVQCAIALLFILVGLQATAFGLGGYDDASGSEVGFLGIVTLSCQTFSRVLVWFALVTCMRQVSVPAFLVNGAACVFNVLGTWLVTSMGGSSRTALTWLVYALLAITVVSIVLPIAVSQRRTAAGQSQLGAEATQPDATPANEPLPPSPALELHAFAQAKSLTTREEQVLGLLIDGRTRGEIERLLGLSEGTVRTHVNNTYKKLGVHSKQEASASFEEWRTNSKG